MEVRYHGIGHREVVGIEDELVGPALHGLDHAAGRNGRFERPHDGRSDRCDLVPLFLGAVDDTGGLVRYEELLGIHLVFREVLDVHRAEIAQPDVERYEGAVDAADLHALHQVFREVHAGRRSGHGALVAGEDRLVAFGVFGFDLFADPFRQRRFAHLEQRLLELLVRAVEQKTQRAAARSGVVDHFGHQKVVVAEVEFVADADLAGGIHQHVPEPQLAVEFAQQEDFDLGARFLLVAVQPGREDLRVVEDEDVLFAEVVDDVLENAVFDGSFRTVDDHQARFVAIDGRIFGQQLGAEVVPVLR